MNESMLRPSRHLRLSPTSEQNVPPCVHRTGEPPPIPPNRCSDNDAHNASAVHNGIIVTRDTK